MGRFNTLSISCSCSWLFKIEAGAEASAGRVALTSLRERLSRTNVWLRWAAGLTIRPSPVLMLTLESFEV